MLLTPKDKHIIVNYHYVEDPRNDFKGIHPCPIKTFEDQIGWLSKNFTITTIEKVYEGAKEGLGEKRCAITFDDGLKDQYENAVPVLRKHAITAIFFPITGTLSGFLPATHKIHVLLSRFTASELIDASNTFLKENYPKSIEYLIPKDRRITETRKLRDDIKTANFKETINILPNALGEEMLNWLFQKLGLNEKTIVRDLFMTENNIIGLAKEGFMFGSHGHHHLALDTQKDSSIQHELQLSKQHIGTLTNILPTIVSYPHGGVNNNVITIAKKEGFLYGLSIMRGGVKKDTNQYQIPRYDTNDIVMY